MDIKFGKREPYDGKGSAASFSTKDLNEDVMGLCVTPNAEICDSGALADAECNPTVSLCFGSDGNNAGAEMAGTPCHTPPTPKTPW